MRKTEKEAPAKSGGKDDNLTIFCFPLLDSKGALERKRSLTLRGRENSQGLLSRDYLVNHRDYLVNQRKQTAAGRALSGNPALPPISSRCLHFLYGSQLRESPLSVVRATEGNRPWGSQGAGSHSHLLERGLEAELLPPAPLPVSLHDSSTHQGAGGLTADDGRIHGNPRELFFCLPLEKQTGSTRKGDRAPREEG